VEVLVRHGEASWWGRGRVAEEFHACFRWCPPCFAAVAGKTTANHILPAMLAPSATRNDVVQSQFFSVPFTILTSILITVEDFEASQLSLKVRTLDQAVKADHRGDRKREADCVYHTQAIFDYLSFILEYQD